MTAKRIENISPFHVMAILDRAKQLAAQGRDIIHLEIGEPDFPTPQAIIDAGIRHLSSGEVKYTPAAGLPALRRQIAAFYQQRYGVTLNSENVFVTPGASGALLLALGVSLNSGANLLMADPCYPCNSNFIALFAGKSQRIAVNAASGYQLDRALIRQHWNPQTKGVLVASPSNPTGTLISGPQLQACIAETSQLGGHFYSDEIYHGLVYNGSAHSALEYTRNAFVINSFSKYFGMTGWRVGWLVVPDRFIDATEKLAQNLFIATATPSQYAALAAFGDETHQELERRRLAFASRRDFLYDHLQRLGFTLPIKPEGAFYIYANCAHLTDDSASFALALLEAEGVAVTPGIDFGEHQARQHLRFAYTQPLPRMAEAIRRLEHFIKTRTYGH